MKSVRLLPIVILAAIALLIFKGLGLATNGGYVLTGTATVVAEDAHGGAASDAGSGAPAPTEPTMTDTSPTLDDNAPTLPGNGAVADPAGAPADEQVAGHAPPPAGSEAPAHAGGEAAVSVAEASAPPPAPGHPAPEAPPGAPDIACPTNGRSPSTQEIGAAIADATSGAAAGRPDCVPVDPHADAVPVTQDSHGNQVPLSSGDGTPLTEKAVLGRLAERRGELDSREAELSMRQALVEAAEKRIAERTAALQALEARINALVDEKKAMEDTEFKALVGMYESMKPADAAAIFNSIDLDVLIRLARGMNPRKMAPIMAKMVPARAEELTVRLADSESEPTIDMAGADLSALPQIVGQ